MKKRWLTLILVVVALSLPIAPTRAIAQVAGTEAVIRSIIAAINTGDIDAALTLVAEDAVITLLPPPPGTKGVFIGKDEIRGWWQSYVAGNGHTEFNDFHVFGNRAVWTAGVEDDLFTSLGIGTLTFDGVGVTQDGLLKSYTWNMSKESQTRLGAALALESKKEVMRRFYDEIWTAGNMATIDEIIHPAFIDHFSGRNGVEEFKQTITLFKTAFPDFSATYTDMVAEGDIVVTRITFTGTYQGGLQEIFGVPDSAIERNYPHRRRLCTHC
ncbi:MAG: ester cyclase [Caldilineaceae bacterium]